MIAFHGDFCIYIFYNFVCVIMYVVKAVGSLWGLSELIGVAYNRIHTQATAGQQDKLSLWKLQLLALQTYTRTINK